MMFLIAPKTGHDMHPESRKTLNAWLYERLKLGRQTPDHIRFVTWTTRYNRDYWITVDGLDRHYEKAEVDATRSADRTKYEITTKNISRLLVGDADQAKTISIDGQNVSPRNGSMKSAPQLAFEKRNGAWKTAPIETTRLRKKHGLQGPIDDAFLEPFLVVRPTGTPWNAAANDEALRILARFERQYSFAYRGHVRIKDDRDVTADDAARYHLVLFGDPGSNRWLARLNGKVPPLRWTKDQVRLGAKTFPAAESLPALIYPNPMSPSHYVVINSGLTAAWADWAGDFPTPRYGDFAVFGVKPGSDDPAPVYAGLFDESWRLR